MPESTEAPDHCTRPVLESRTMLTRELGQLTSADELDDSLRALRPACRKLLDTIQPRQHFIEQHRSTHGHSAICLFLCQMRGVFGVHLAILAVKFGVSVEGGLQPAPRRSLLF